MNELKALKRSTLDLWCTTGVSPRYPYVPQLDLSLFQAHSLDVNGKSETICKLIFVAIQNLYLFKTK